MQTAASVLKRLREICETLPEVVETTSYGHPSFKAGRKRRMTFAVLDDHERGDALCIVFKAPLDLQRQLVTEPGFFPCKYGAKHGWTTFVVGKAVDWPRLEELVTQSYAMFANKRMMATFVDAEARGAPVTSRSRSKRTSSK